MTQIHRVLAGIVVLVGCTPAPPPPTPLLSFDDPNYHVITGPGYAPAYPTLTWESIASSGYRPEEVSGEVEPASPDTDVRRSQEMTEEDQAEPSEHEFVAVMARLRRDISAEPIDQAALFAPR